MLDAGLIDEVEALLSAGWGRNSALGRTIGYTEVLAFLDGSITRKMKLLKPFPSIHGAWYEDRRTCLKELKELTGWKMIRI